MRRIAQIIRDHRGSTAVEYGLILALVFLAIASSVQSLADQTVAMWDYVSDTVVAAVSN